MNLTYIKEFVHLTENLEFRKTANQLSISYSSLSNHIKSLEEELGAPLLYRTTRTVKLTDFGTLFLPYAKRICAASSQFDTGTSVIDQDKPSLIVGISAISYIEDIAQIILSSSELQNYTIKIIEAPSKEIKQMLDNNECDIAIVRDLLNEENPGYESILIRTDSAVAVFPIDHPLFSDKPIPLEQLYKEKLLLRTDPAYLKNYCVDFFRDNGFEPNVIFIGHSVSQIIRLVSVGYGVGMLTSKPLITDAEFQKKVVFSEIAPPLYSALNILYKKNGNKVQDIAKLLPLILPSITEKEYLFGSTRESLKNTESSPLMHHHTRSIEALPFSGSSNV